MVIIESNYRNVAIKTNQTSNKYQINVEYNQNILQFNFGHFNIVIEGPSNFVETSSYKHQIIIEVTSNQMKFRHWSITSKSSKYHKNIIEYN